MPLLYDVHQAARQRVVDRRARVERMLELAQVLPDAQRALLEQVFRRGATSAELARLWGESPRKMQRRLRGLIRRLRHPLLAFAFDHMDLIPAQARPTVRLVHFEGLSLRAAARQRRKSLHEIRAHLALLRQLAGL